MIAETMTVVRTHGPRDYRVEEIPVPSPGPGEVLIEVDACGICASDMKCWLGGELFWGSDGKSGYCEPPAVAGHEFAGHVVALGEGAAERHGVQLGDRVIAEQIIPCGECRFCQNGQYWMCQVHPIFGFKSFLIGGMAKYSLYPAKSIVHKVPESLSAGEAAYVEPAACAWHAVERGEIKQGDTVVIAGVGNIGLCMLQIAKLFEPGQLIALDAKDYRLDIASQMGADVSINVTEEDAVQRVKDLTDGYGCDVFIEATGNPAAVPLGSADDPQARHLRRVQRLQRAGNGQLDDHRRYQRAEHPRQPPRAVLLPEDDRRDRRRPARRQTAHRRGVPIDLVPRGDGVLTLRRRAQEHPRPGLISGLGGSRRGMA